MELKNNQNKFYMKLKHRNKNQNNLLNNSESGSEDNVGVEALEKVLGEDYEIPKSIKNRFNRNKTLKYKINFEYRKRLKYLVNTNDYINSSNYHKFMKRKRIKKQIRESYRMKNQRSFNVIKNKLSDIGDKIKTVIFKNKKLSIGFLLILILFIFAFQLSSLFSGLSAGINNSVLTTTYLSKESMLIAMNQSYSTKELNLENNLNRIKENYPNYDEYVINKKDEIGHDSHVLLSYLTSRFGDVKNLVDVEQEIQNLFNEVYSFEYREEVETRYDSEGNPYTYSKLIINVYKNDMDKIIREKFKDSPNNLRHYEMLLESKGNMLYLFGEDGLGIRPSGISNIYDFDVNGGIFPPLNPNHVATLNGGYS